MRNVKSVVFTVATLVITAPLALAQTSNGSAFGSARGATVNNTRALENSQPNANANQAGRAQLAETNSALNANAQSGASQLNAADRNFLSDTARGAAFELQASQLATEKAQNPQVKQYATMVVEDHAQMN